MPSRREADKENFNYFRTTCGLIGFIVFFLGSFLAFIVAKETDQYSQYIIIFGFVMLTFTTMFFCCVLHESKKLCLTETEPDESNEPQPEPELPLQPQPKPELPLQPQPKPELSLQPQPKPELPLQPQPKPELPLQPQPEPELPLQPQPEPELPLQPQPEPELPLQPQPEPELPLQPQPEPELPLQPQPEPELPLQPQPEPELPLQPQPEQKLSGKPKKEPHWYDKTKLDFAFVRQILGLSPRDSDETTSSENDSSKVAGKKSEVTEFKSDLPLKDMSALSLSDSSKCTTDCEDKQAEVSAALSRLSLDSSEKQAAKMSAQDPSSTDFDGKSNEHHSQHSEISIKAEGGESSKLESKKEA